MTEGRGGESARGSSDESFRARAIELWVLNALALAQPIFAILGPNPAFFVAHDTGAEDVVLLVMVLLAGVPLAALALEALAGRAGPRVRVWVHVGLCALLVALMVYPAFRRLARVHEMLDMVGALAAGGLFVVLHRRWATGRQLLRFFAPVPLVFLGVFLWSDAVRPLLAPAESRASVGTSGATPVVFLLLDELPLFTLLGPDRTIDATLFPSFARLASRSIWYRNATAVDTLTTFAVPSILMGRRVRAPTVTFPMAPHNLFSWLATTHRLVVGEAVTNLCPPGACERMSKARGSDPAMLLRDVAVVYGHWALPPSLSKGLPAIESRWADFANRSDPRERGDRIRGFIASIRGGDRPTLYFLHVLLPHVPWTGLPSGMVYPARVKPVIEKRPKEDWPTRVAFQRHLFQVGYVDRLLGELLDRLDATGLFDRALIVVTADHGMTFQTGKRRRKADADTLRDILHVPLFVKPPFLREGRVSDQSVESVDILPTIAEALQLRLPFSVEGRSALRPPLAVPADRHGSSYGRPWTIDATLPSTWPGLQMKTALFGAHPSWDDVWATSSAPELIGRRVDTLPTDDRSGLFYGLLDTKDFAAIDPASGRVPSYMHGVVWSGTASMLPGEVAVAVDGVVCGVGRLFGERDITKIMSIVVNPNPTGAFAMMCRESAFHAGNARVEAFGVAPDRRLIRMEARTPPRVLKVVFPEQ